ncbi:MAG TPA: hypothetical protein DCO77_07145 [Nitrospiraceae bacterium]|nr:hypothetical protein [Nitrospiraceae bacterium]
MNTKRWLLASLAVVVVFFVLEMIIHGMLLQGLYLKTAQVWRPQAEMMGLMWLSWLGYLIFAPFFAFIYTKGHETGKSGLGQGLRYGVLMGLMLSPMQSLSWYAVLPIPGILAFAWFLAGMVVITASGIAVGLIYREK